jgi:hypothetical protein
MAELPVTRKSYNIVIIVAHTAGCLFRLVKDISPTKRPISQNQIDKNVTMA